MSVNLLDPKRMVFATAKAFGETNKRAAELAKITPGTASEYIKEPAVQAKINEIQLDTLYEAQNKFRGYVTSAVNTVAEIMNKSKSDKMRLEAAKYILDTVDIAPAREGGLWWVGPTTGEEIESREHEKAVRQRLLEIREELHRPLF